MNGNRIFSDITVTIQPFFKLYKSDISSQNIIWLRIKSALYSNPEEEIEENSLPEEARIELLQITEEMHNKGMAISDKELFDLYERIDFFVHKFPNHPYQNYLYQEDCSLMLRRITQSSNLKFISRVLSLICHLLYQSSVFPGFFYSNGIIKILNNILKKNDCQYDQIAIIGSFLVMNPLMQKETINLLFEKSIEMIMGNDESNYKSSIIFLICSINSKAVDNDQFDQIVNIIRYFLLRNVLINIKDAFFLMLYGLEKYPEKSTVLSQVQITQMMQFHFSNACLCYQDDNIDDQIYIKSILVCYQYLLYNHDSIIFYVINENVINNFFSLFTKVDDESRVFILKNFTYIMHNSDNWTDLLHNNGLLDILQHICDDTNFDLKEHAFECFIKLIGSSSPENCLNVFNSDVFTNITTLLIENVSNTLEYLLVVILEQIHKFEMIGKANEIAEALASRNITGIFDTLPDVVELPSTTRLYVESIIEFLHRM